MRKLILFAGQESRVASGMSNAEKQAARRVAKNFPLDQEPSGTTCGALDIADFLAPTMPVHYSGNHSEHRTELDEPFIAMLQLLSN